MYTKCIYIYIYYVYALVEHEAPVGVARPGRIKLYGINNIYIYIIYILYILCIFTLCI